MRASQVVQDCKEELLTEDLSGSHSSSFPAGERRKKKLYPYARILAKDLPGSDSFGCRRKRSLAGIADADGKLLGFLKTREPAVIGGLPAEGYGMLEFFLRLPERVRGVMLYSTRDEEDDVIVLPLESHGAWTLLKASEVHKIAREGHQLNGDRPESFISLVEVFLETEFCGQFRRKMDKKLKENYQGRNSRTGKGRSAMKLFRSLIFVFAAGLTLTGCNGAFWGGTAGGTAATGAAYELRARQQMEKIDGQLERGEIDQREYDIRKDQIKQGSLAY